jgi:hypothetical protein
MLYMLSMSSSRKLEYCVDHKQLRIFDIHHPRHATRSTRGSLTHGHATHLVTNTTLCNLLFEFLATVRELRLVPKQKNLLPPCRQHRMPSTSS